ncbi:MAG: pyridoxamine 5'-phosphate oxidase [Bacteroidetes bacterium]|nr:pyridoxamine 5'-phosphate oxidase [Bacteroidota bacterium]
MEAQRLDYQKNEGLEITNLIENPFEQFLLWFGFAVQTDAHNANAMALSTIHNNKPSSRIVLLKELDATGFTFYTNYNSHKSNEISENKYASLLFFWKENERQIRIEGTLEKVSESASDEYFKTRPRESQIGAWASPQSTPITREELQKRVAEFSEMFEGKEVPRPQHWGGFRLLPEKFEFWQGRASRLHDRFVFEKKNNSWDIYRIAP